MNENNKFRDMLFTEKELKLIYKTVCMIRKSTPIEEKKYRRLLNISNKLSILLKGQQGNEIRNTQKIIFEISKTTPYTCDDIVDFLILTKIDIHKAERTISNLCYAGVSNLTDICTIIKLGYYCF